MLEVALIALDQIERRGERSDSQEPRQVIGIELVDLPEDHPGYAGRDDRRFRCALRKRIENDREVAATLGNAEKRCCSGCRDGAILYGVGQCFQIREGAASGSLGVTVVSIGFQDVARKEGDMIELIPDEFAQGRDNGAGKLGGDLFLVHRGQGGERRLEVEADAGAVTVDKLAGEQLRHVAGQPRSERAEPR